MNPLINFTKILNNNIVAIFIFFLILCVCFGIFYFCGLYPSNKKIKKIIVKFNVDNYTLPYHIAERYLIWLNMRTFFFGLNYTLTLTSIIATLLTAFYASTQNDNQIIIFFSLASTFFTIANIFVNSGSKANASQHAWRELDTCITLTIHNLDLSDNEKNAIIASKIVEMEKYMELYDTQ